MSQKDKHDYMQCEKKKNTIQTLCQQNMDMNAALGDEKFKKERILLAEKQQQAQLQELLDKMEALNKELMHLKEGAATLENISIYAFTDREMADLL